jgi:hypothetical protein
MSFFKKITLSGFLIALSSLIFLVFFFRDIFSSEIQIWCKAHLKVFVSAILITLLSRLIGLLKSEDFENSDSFPVMFGIQIFLSYSYDGKLFDYGSSSYYFILIFPTIVFIARTYFKRIQRIENMLTELNNEIKQLRQVEGIVIPPKVYQDDDMIQLPDGTWEPKDSF